MLFKIKHCLPIDKFTNLGLIYVEQGKRKFVLAPLLIPFLEPIYPRRHFK